LDDAAAGLRSLAVNALARARPSAGEVSDPASYASANAHERELCEVSRVQVMSGDAAHHLLFSYGTLQHADVQRATFGRLLEGTQDALAGYRLEPQAVDDPDLIEHLGKTVHVIARRSGDPVDRIDGVALRVTAAELAASDDYEVAPYTRVAVTLASGAAAFVYAAPV
jgi:hypothetical protein